MTRILRQNAAFLRTAAFLVAGFGGGVGAFVWWVSCG